MTSRSTEDSLDLHRASPFAVLDEVGRGRDFGNDDPVCWMLQRSELSLAAPTGRIGDAARHR